MEHRLCGTKIASSIEKAAIHKFAMAVLVLFIPFLMFYWMLPFVSELTLGNDYVLFPIHHQLELMFCLKTGSFPLYIPGFAGGQSASALTLGQLYHPISHLTSLLPGYWSGKALEWNTFFRLISMGFAHLWLFHLLKKLNIRAIWAFAISFMTVYNLRMLDLFRYGASLESWTGYLFLCAAIGFYYLKPAPWKGPVLIIGATYWLICSGHPQMMYYGLLGAGLFTLVFPFFTRAILVNWNPDTASIYRFWLRTAIFGAVGLLLSSAYTLPFYFDFVVSNAHRVAQDYVWADAYRDTLMGTLNNFFQPLRSDVMGVFGGSSLILTVALLPLLRLFQVKVPSVIWCIWGILVLAFLHMQGGRTPVHFLVWKFFPLASSFRIAGRISLIMPVFFMLVLTWLANAEVIRLKIFNRQLRVLPWSLLASAALILIGGYLLIPASIIRNTTIYSAVSIRQVPPRLESIALLCGAASLALVAIQGHLRRLDQVGEALLLLFVGVQIGLLLQYGTWIEKKKDTPTLAQMYLGKEQNLNYRSATGYGLANSVVIRQAQMSFLEPFLGRIYRSYRIAENNEMAYTLMEQDRSPEQVTIEQYTLKQHLPDKQNRGRGYLNSAKLVYSSFNRLVFEVQCARKGFFSLAYPYTGHWRAYINEQEVPVYRANGAYHAIEVPDGSSRVEFRYWSPAGFWGMVISCITFLSIGVMVSFRATKRPLNILILVSLCILIIAGFSYWYRSLYKGANLGTSYFWKETSSAPFQNIAYGKRTYMSSLLYENYPYYRSNGQAVDGNYTPGSGFITGFEPNPWWVVDLYRPRSVGTVVIYEGTQGSSFNLRPLTLAFSSSQKSWQTVETINDGNHNSPLIIKLKKPQDARYILIMASGTCHLSLDEVEIYSAEKIDS